MTMRSHDRELTRATGERHEEGEHGADRPLTTTAGMEPLWSQAGATGGNRSQMAPLRKRLKQANRQPVDAKEGVRGSSPREGFTNPLLTSFLVVR
jgi:hypothetical protein